MRFTPGQRHQNLRLNRQNSVSRGGRIALLPERKDGLMKVCGNRINPWEIEPPLVATGQAMEVAVLGAGDELLGSRLVAIAAPANGQACEWAVI